MNDDKQRKWLTEHGVKLADVRPDGSDVDMTRREDSRLGERAASLRKHAKRLTKSRR
jgi:hypothetical protein